MAPPIHADGAFPSVVNRHVMAPPTAHLRWQAPAPRRALNPATLSSMHPTHSCGCRMRGSCACLLLLAAALLCTAAAPAAAFGRLRLDPPPHADVFAWRALTTAADAGLDRQVVNHCIDGSSVAGVWVAFKQTDWQRAGRV